MDVSDDFALLDAWRAGDSSAGDRLFAAHFESIFRFFRNKVDDTAAEDLTQAVLLACVDGRDRFRHAASFRTYLFAIVRNHLLMHYRKKGRSKEAFADDTTSVADLGASPRTLAQARQEQELLLLALQRIPIDFQIAVELYYWENVSTRELAEILAIPEGTVRSRLARAREHLAREIEALAASPQLRESTMQGFDTWARSLKELVG